MQSGETCISLSRCKIVIKGLHGIHMRSSLKLLRNHPMFRTRSVGQLAAQSQGEHGLRRILGLFELILLGIGAVVGTGIFVITGIAASDYAGPAIVISFVISGLVCILAALCYAEFSAMVPVAGSAYTYCYTSLGEIWAWIIGWDLILEYAVSISAVAIGWSAYITTLLAGSGISLPYEFVHPPGAEGGSAGDPDYPGHNGGPCHRYAGERPSQHHNRADQHLGHPDLPCPWLPAY